MRTEGVGVRLLRAQAGHLFHQTSDFRHHHVVHAGRRRPARLETEDVGQYFILSLRATLKILTATLGSTVDAPARWHPPSCEYCSTWYRRK